MAVMAWRFFTTGGIEMLRAHARRPGELANQVQDSVCGMTVDSATAAEKFDYAGATYTSARPAVGRHSLRTPPGMRPRRCTRGTQTKVTWAVHTRWLRCQEAKWKNPERPAIPSAV